MLQRPVRARRKRTLYKRVSIKRRTKFIGSSITGSKNSTDSKNSSHRSHGQFMRYENRRGKRRRSKQSNKPIK